MKRAAIIALSLLTLHLPPSAFSAEPGARASVPKGTAILGTDMENLKTLMTGAEAKPEWYSDEAPSRKAETGDFEIDVYEITNKRFKVHFKDHQYPMNMENHPVVNVTWREADEYCRAAGGRLPSEAEWVRAARGDTAALYPWGDVFSPDNAVYMDTPGGGAPKVGSYATEMSDENMLGGTHAAGSVSAGKSPYGVYDMAGNAWEWVDGWYDDVKKLRPLKGGSWLTPKESLRVSARLGDDGGKRYNDYGFRCVYGK